VVGGQYQYREGGEYHLVNPATISKLQQEVRPEQSGDVPGVHDD